MNEVRALAGLIEKGNLASAVTVDSPAILHDAIAVYTGALAATLNENRKHAKPEREGGGRKPPKGVLGSDE